MKNLIIPFLIVFTIRNSSFCQDTTYYSEFELANIEYSTISDKIGNRILLDRAISLETSKTRTLSSTLQPTIEPNDWLYLFHAKNLATKDSDLSGAVKSLNENVYYQIEDRSYINNKLTFPVGIIDFIGTTINEESYITGKLFYNNGWDFDKESFKEIFRNERYSLTSVLVEGPIEDAEVRFELSDDFIFENGPHVIYTKLTYNGQIMDIYRNSGVDIYLNQNEQIITFETFFDDGTSVINHVKLNLQIQNKGKTKSSYPFDFEAKYFAHDESDITNLELNFGIIYGACNHTGSLVKPVIMLHGYRPPIQNSFPSLQKLYDSKFNFKGDQYGDAGFVELLVRNGYDVIICRIDPGYKSITEGGRLMASFIKNYVETEKEQSASKYETIVLGFSMGGQYWRYAMVKMEYEHLYGSEKNHHIRMWIPVDSPNEGANIPLAHQWAAWSLHEELAGAPVFNIAYNGLNTPGSREQMRYHFDGVEGFDGAYHKFHPARSNYVSLLNNTYYLGDYYIKYRGYPSASRNIAISVASNSNDDYSALQSGGLTWSDDSQVIGLVSTKRWDVKLYAESFRLSNNPQLLFKRYITRQIHINSNINVLVDHSRFESHLLEMDNCFGSYHNKIRETINDGLDVNSLFGFNDYDYEGNQVFVPSVSALAINPREWPNNLKYNLINQNLLFKSTQEYIDNASNNYYGYPHIGRPNDYREVTPMDAVFCDQYTYEHITLVDDVSGHNDQSILIDFLLNEIEPWYLDVQNQNVGKYARSNYRYTAKYQAKNWIRSGNNITAKTPFGDYVVEPNADLEFQSGELIELKPGTHIRQGAIFHAYIEPLCDETKSLSISNSPDEITEYSDNNFSDNSTKNKENTNMIYPNPNEGTFSIYCKNLENSTGELYLYNTQGVLITIIPVSHQQKIDISSYVQSKSLVYAKIILDQTILFTSKILIL